MIGSTELGSPAQLMGVISSPEAARELLGDGRGAAMWADHYRHFVILDSARAAYGRLFSDVASANHRPALFHCSTGKDRTGWAASAFLLLLGVPDDLVMEDFMRSLDYLAPLIQPALDRFAAQGGDPDLLSPIFGLQPHYLEAGLEQVRQSFGSIEGYFADGLGIDPGAQRTLRETFVEPA